MSSSAQTITVSGHGPPETIAGAIRALFCCASFVAIAWFDHSVAKLAVGGVCLVASPSLARAVVAPFLARILRSAVRDYSTSEDPMITRSGRINPNV